MADTPASASAIVKDLEEQLRSAHESVWSLERQLHQAKLHNQTVCGVEGHTFVWESDNDYHRCGRYHVCSKCGFYKV